MENETIKSSILSRIQCREDVSNLLESLIEKSTVVDYNDATSVARKFILLRDGLRDIITTFKTLNQLDNLKLED